MLLTKPRLLALLIVLLGLAVAGWWFWGRSSLPAGDLDAQTSQLVRDVSDLEASEEQIAETIWAKELLAQQCARVWEELWDQLNSATNKLAVLAEFSFGEVVLPRLSTFQKLAHGIELATQESSRPPWTQMEWKSFLEEIRKEGWRLVQAEFRHIEFNTDERGRPARSRFYTSVHLTNSAAPQRAIVEGHLLVDWAGSSRRPSRVQAEGLSVRRRQGDPAFSEVLVESVAPPSGSFFIDPLILYDLTGDGASEIILAAKNLVYYRQNDGSFLALPLCRHPPGLIFTGILGDFDGDGVVDFLCAKFEGLSLFRGSPGSTFDEPGQPVWSAQPRLRYAQTITAGDVDGDGDLDLWLGQYKVPYDRGQMPTPYYNAQDGHPSFLLLNDGRGTFTDQTMQAGLGPKRYRRAYSGSLLDLNHDGHLDLVIASDFAGLELFLNEGRGRFTDRTALLRPTHQGFGMSQLGADFNQDGRLDLLMLGMNVPVADRLVHYGAARPGFESYLRMAAPMTYGNRLYLGQADGGFVQGQLSQSVARSGWSWAASPLDFDNDSFPDLYVANGHESKQSVRDYETEFWLHDIYVGNSHDNLTAFAYFQTKSARTRGQGMSYGGYEKNRLFWNQQGQTFLEVGHLMGLALEQDSRNTAADDFDLDGRRDLVLTTFEVWPHVRQTLRVYRNQLSTPGHWIGIRLGQPPGAPSPIGARVEIRFADRTVSQALVAGDSYRSQTSNTLHFGLGDSMRVERVDVRWLNGRTAVLENPSIDQYHTVTPR